MGSSEEQFCLRWNDFQQCIKSTFQDLREDKDFQDVTISCEGEQIKAHKVILSACSVTFRNLLRKNPAQHPVIVLWDVSPGDLTSIMDFMYHGEVNVRQENLNSFLAVAERLRVRGLCQNDKVAEESSKKDGGGGGSNSVVQKSRNGSGGGEAGGRPRDSAASDTPCAKRQKVTANDMIQEVDPTGLAVKQERLEVSAARPRSSAGQEQEGFNESADYQIAEPEQSYEEGEYAEYSGYEDMGYMSEQGAAMMANIAVDPSSAKDRSCPFCNKVFKVASYVKIHIRDIHTKTEQKFICNFCNKMFKSKNTLSNHRSLYHKDEKYFL